MTDRELLELAAKAAGVKVFSYIDNPMWGTGINTGEVDEELWNPLANDSDALRLAVKLGLAIRVLEKCVFVESDPETLLGQSQYSELEMYGNSDHYAATRRVIVRAAAAIGEQMK